MSAYALQKPDKCTSIVESNCLLPSERFEIRPPKVHWSTSVNARPEDLPSPDKHIVTQPVDLISVTNASVYLSGSRYLVSTSDGTVVSRAGINNTRLAEIPWETHRHLHGTSFILGNSAGARNYYHWTLDLLPKLGYLENSGFKLNSIDHFLVRDAKTPFQIESLKKLGIDESRIVETANQPNLICDTVLQIPLKHKINMSMHPFVPKWVNSVFNESDSLLKKPSKKLKLYLKRSSGSRRGIKNADDLEKMLAENGFETATMDGLSISQQAHILAQAETIISPHGGALTNMVYAPPGTKIIELFGTHVLPYYFGLANLCKHEYHAILQTQQDYEKLVNIKSAMKAGNPDNQAITQHEEYSVDLVALKKAILACS